MKSRFFTDDYGNEWMEFDSKLFPEVRNKVMLPKWGIIALRKRPEENAVLWKYQIIYPPLETGEEEE